MKVLCTFSMVKVPFLGPFLNYDVIEHPSLGYSALASLLAKRSFHNSREATKKSLKAARKTREKAPQEESFVQVYPSDNGGLVCALIEPLEVREPP